MASPISYGYLAFFLFVCFYKIHQLQMNLDLTKIKSDADADGVLDNSRPGRSRWSAGRSAVAARCFTFMSGKGPYLQKDIQNEGIQNELLNLMSSQLTKEIVAKIHTAKYFSIILDCTPDISHQEQMSIVIRIVELQPEPEIK